MAAMEGTYQHCWSLAAACKAFACRLQATAHNVKFATKCLQRWGSRGGKRCASSLAEGASNKCMQSHQ